MSYPKENSEYTPLTAGSRAAAPSGHYTVQMPSSGQAAVQPPPAYSAPNLVYSDADNIYDLGSEKLDGSFESTFVEAEGSTTLEIVRRINGLVFVHVRDGVYILLTATLGLFLSLIYAFFFAMLQFSISYWFAPFAKMFVMSLRSVGKVWRVWVRISLDPLFESFGKTLSYIRVRMGLQAASSSSVPAITVNI